jgi:hypothetical protein
MSRVENPFLTCPFEPKDPHFRSYVLDPVFDRFWKRKETQWNAYGIPVDREAYVLLYISQDGKCGICGRSWRASGKLLAVDHGHDHYNPRVRGLLDSCNYDLGVKETKISCGANVRWTPQQFAYLKRSPAGIELLYLVRF